MKKTKLVLFTAALTLCSFVAIIYSSCKKDPCSGVSCQNGGACSNGSCACPTGYSGTFCQNSSITFQNDTYTPISIAVNGSTATIDVGSSISFVGAAGSAATVTAATSGTTSSGNQVGQLISWSFTDNFPTGSATLTEPLDVDASYFYLYMVNDNPSQSIVSVYVNYGTTAQSLDNISIPNDGNTYGIGYYRAYSNTEVYATSSLSGNYWSWYPYIPNVANASATVTAN